MKTELVKITPELAQQLLKRNTRNRKLRPEFIYKYAGFMARGEWKFTNQTIGISKTEKILDGQHRLHAIVRSGVTIPMYIISGLDDDVMTEIDTGLKRSTGDAFGLLDVPQANNIAAAIALMVKLKNKPTSFVGSEGGLRQVRFGQALSTQEQYDLYLKHEAVITSCLGLASKCYSAVRFYTLSQIMGISMYLIIDKKHSFSKVSDFWLNVHMVKTDKIPACKALSAVLLKYLSGSEKIKPRYKSAITIKAWNAYLKSDMVKVLKFSTQENFPEFQ